MTNVSFVGLQFNWLTVISFSYSKNNLNFWFCKCVCGKRRIVSEKDLIKNRIRTCGCLIKQSLENRSVNAKHLEAWPNLTKEYGAWNSMKARCYTKTNKRYYTHGARGISVCDRWLKSYDNFLTDMGRAPSRKHSLERIDNDGNYNPNNCKWALPLEQANNKRNNRIIEYKGNKYPLAKLCRSMNLNHRTVWDRLKNGWSVEKAIETPVRKLSSLKNRYNSSSSQNSYNQHPPS